MSARARLASRYSAMATRGNSLLGRRKNIVWGVRRESVAVRVSEHLLVAAHLLVTREGGPLGKFRFGRCSRWQGPGRFFGSLRHGRTITSLADVRNPVGQTRHYRKRPRQNRGL